LPLEFYAEDSHRVGWVGFRHSEKRLLTLFLGFLKPGKFQCYCQECSNSRCSWVCLLPKADYTILACPLLCYTYRRGLLRCSFNSNGQSRASESGTSNSTDSHAFFMPSTLNNDAVSVSHIGLKL
jgi:hypothetical protein